VIPAGYPEQDCYHLSAMTLTRHLYLPTLGHRTGSPQTTVYMAFQHTRFTLPACCHTATWALTPHFHPYPGRSQGGYFLWHYLSRSLAPRSHPLGGVLPYAVRTFLPPIAKKTIARFVVYVISAQSYA